MIRGIVGTAGHIDHGKTALVEALTGIRTDRLPEEKRRGITIDLGFAHMELSDGVAGLIDVPGHEDFIRNMVAGASGIDLLLLVVAADEGVMPQTREHVAIAGILGVPRAVVALTKTDLVDPEWLALAREDVADYLAETPFAAAPILPTSAVTGAGVGELMEALRDALPGARGQADDLFRLPIDRAFTVHGTGTVVTGTVWSGTLGVDQQVRVLPGDRRVRVRSLQVHGQATDAIRPGQRAAVALAGLDLEDAGRGATLVTDAAWEASDALTTRLRLLPGTEWEIEHGQRLRIHLATTEVMGRAFLLERETMVPGAEAWVQLRLESPVVARTGDRFVVRSYSPLETIGGGVVAEPMPQRRRRLRMGEAEALTERTVDDPVRRVAAVIRQAGVAGVRAGELPILAGATPATVRDAMDAHAVVMAGDTIFAGEAAGRVADVLLQTVAAFHERYPLRTRMDVEELRRGAPQGAAEPLVARVLTRLVEDRRLVMAEGRAALPGFEPRLTADQSQRKDRLMEAVRAAGHEPPRVDDLFQGVGGADDLADLLALLEADGLVRRLDHETVIDAARIDDLIRQVRDRFGGRTDVTPAEFREVVPASRRHLLPILEYFDRVGVTVRAGEGRAVTAPRG
jgi:selenocysteine-specific elongation factor